MNEDERKDPQNYEKLPKDHWARKAPTEKILTLLKKLKVKESKLENQNRVQLQKILQAYRKLNAAVRATVDSEYSVDRIVQPEWQQNSSTETIDIVISDDEQEVDEELDSVRDESKSIVASPNDKEVEEKLSNSALDQAEKTAYLQIKLKRVGRNQKIEITPEHDHKFSPKLTSTNEKEIKTEESVAVSDTRIILARNLKFKSPIKNKDRPDLPPPPPPSQTEEETMAQLAQLATPPTFGNREYEEMEEFLLSFNHFAKGYDWNDKTKWKKLNVALKEGALTRWAKLTKTNEDTEWEETEKEFKTIFKKDKETIREKIRTLKYKKGEDFQLFVDKYQNYCKQLNPTMKQEDIMKDLTRNIPYDMKEWIIEKEIENCNKLIEEYPKYLKRKEWKEDGTNEEKLKKRMEEMEKELAKLRIMAENKTPEVGTSKNSANITKQPESKEEGTAIEKAAIAILNQIKCHTTSRGQGHNSYERGRNPNIRGRRGNCHNCGKYGHWSKECWSPYNNQVRGRGSYQYRGRSDRYDQYYRRNGDNNRYHSRNNSYNSRNNHYNSRNNSYDRSNSRSNTRNESKSPERCSKNSKN